MDDLPGDEQFSHLGLDAAGLDTARAVAGLSGADRSADPFAAVARATWMPILVTNPREAGHPIVFANDAFCRLTGYAREEILGRNCRFLQGPGTDPALIDRIRGAVAAAEPIEIDIRNYRKDGQPFWNRLMIAPVRDANGVLAYFFSNQLDVTLETERLTGLERHDAAMMAEVAGRLHAQHAQRKSEARFRFATHAGRFGVWERDLRSNELTASARFKDGFGRDRKASFTYQDMQECIHPDDRGRVEVAVDRAIAAGADYDDEYRIVRPGGAVGWMQMRAQVVLDADGVASRMAGISIDVTERRQAELHLELSEQSLRLATEAAEVGTWDIDMSTNVMTWSDRHRAMFGISPGVAVSVHDFFAGLYPDDRKAIGKLFDSAVDATLQTAYTAEYRTIGKEDNVVRWVSATGRGVFENGKCMHILGTATDITARKHASGRQRFLLNLLDRLRQLADPGAIMDAAVQALGRYLGVNRVGYGYVQADDATIMLEHGYADGVELLIGSFPMQEFGPYNIARLRQGLTVVSDDITAEPGKYPKFWSTIQVCAFVSVPLIRNGRLTASLYVNQSNARAWSAEDISLIEDVAARTWDTIERARAEAALQEAKATLEQQVMERTAALQASEARLRTIFETSFQFEALLALDGTLIDANATLLEAIHCKLGDVVGKPIWDTPWFTGTPGMPAAACAAVASARQGQAIQQDIVVNLPTGRRSFDFGARAMRDQHGVIIAVICEAVESTGRLQAEALLRQAQKMEAVGQLTGGLAHDFNNMLQGIGSGLELAQRRLVQGRNAEAGSLMATARKGVDRAAALTHRLLAFARRQALDAKPIVVDGLMLGLVELIQRTVGPAIEVRTRMRDGEWPALCDANQLESALLNLVINARDAMPDGGVLSLCTHDRWLSPAELIGEGGRAEDGARTGDHVEIAVNDTGVGMTPDVLARVLEPFFTTKPLGEGTGLGLSQVYGFVRQSGGLLRLESVPGRGTTVRILLPRHHGEVAALVASTHAKAPASASAGKTVLLVEDEAAVRATTAEALRDQGYTVLEAEDAAAGLRLFAGGPRVELLVTDVGLPGHLNGRQLADALRERNPRLPVLFITGYAGSLFDRALAPGMQVIGKPFTLDTLTARVQAMLEAVFA